MGLDMYLKASAYVGNWPHDGADERATFSAIISALKLPVTATSDGAPSLTVDLNVAYWRKANAIHAWFVKNVQNGEDDCGTYEVSREQLKQLAEICRDVLADRGTAREKLTPKQGFFFGTYDLDEWYWGALEYTATRIEELLSCAELEHYSFTYHSSW